MAALNPAFLGVIFLAYFSCAWSFPGPDEPIPAIYPYPRIVLLGPTGVGKSTLANVLAGCAPKNDTCFKTCSGTNSCTGNTTVNVVTYLGDDSLGEFTLVDTPGFGDSHASGDGPLIANMVDVLKNTLGEANIIVLCQEYGRFDPEIQTMILEMESLFGRDQIWNHVMLEVTKWSFKKDDIFERNVTGVTEESALADINTSIMEISHLNQSLPGVFIDSYSQFYPDDEVQQQYFQDYTKQLWTLANNTETLGFYTIEDILEQLHECQTVNDCLNDVLDERITNIEQSVGHNEDQISTLWGNVDVNAADIRSNLNNITDIEKSVGHNEGQISMLWGNVDVNAVDIRSNLNNITDIGKSVNHNKDNISTLEGDVGLNTVNIDSNLATINTNVNSIASNLGLINSNTGLIKSNSGNITTHSGLIDTNSGLIDTNLGLITANTGLINSNTGLITTNTGLITSHTADIKHIKDRQDTQVAQCGYRQTMTDQGPITYSHLTTNVATDHSILDTDTGTYRVLTTGQFVITFSAYVSMDTGERAYIYLYRDGTILDDTRYVSYYVGNNHSYDQGSRTVVLSLTAGQEIQMRADYNTADIRRIMFCIHLV